MNILLTFFRHFLYQGLFPHPSKQRFLCGEYFPYPLRVNVTFSLYLPDFFGLLLALSCRTLNIFFFPILVLTLILKLLILIFFSPPRDYYFLQVKAGNIFTLVVYASSSHSTLSAERSPAT